MAAFAAHAARLLQGIPSPTHHSRDTQQQSDSRVGSEAGLSLGKEGWASSHSHGGLLPGSWLQQQQPVHGFLEDRQLSDQGVPDQGITLGVAQLHTSDAGGSLEGHAQQQAGPDAMPAHRPRCATPPGSSPGPGPGPGPGSSPELCLCAHPW